MKIESIQLWHVALPTLQPRNARDDRLAPRETVLVRLQSQGAEGWGEASAGAGPFESGEWAFGVFACLRDWLAKALVGESISSGQELQERLAVFRGNAMAKAALDAAWWDLEARGRGIPLSQLLGGSRPAVQPGAVCEAGESIDEVIAAVDSVYKAGYARVTLNLHPGWDLQVVRAVRSAFPSTPLAVDCKGSFRLSQRDLFWRLEDFQLAMIEQPFAADDLVAHAMLQQGIRTPICLGQSITSTERAEQAIDLDCCRLVKIEPSIVGGLTPALGIANLCQEAKIPCMLGSRVQSAIGTRVGLSLAALANFQGSADFFAAGDYLADDLAPPPALERDDLDQLQIPLWSAPGIGVVPEANKLRQFAIQQAHC